MMFRKKTAIRLTILALIAVGMCGSAAAFYVVRQKQMERDIEERHAQALIAFEDGDYFNAMHGLGTYINRHPHDVEALYQYAQARQNVFDPAGRHLYEAVGVLRRVLALEPEHQEAVERLLGLYDQLRYSTEAIDAADRVLARHPDSVPALRSKALALARLDRFSDALPVAQQLSQTLPLDIDAQLMSIDIMSHLGQSADQILAYATEQRDAHPDDPRMQTFYAIVCRKAGRNEDALTWCRRAAEQTVTEPACAARIVGLLDTLGRHQEAHAFLARVATPNSDPGVRRALARRQWEAGRWNEMIERLADIDIADRDADAELLGLKALSYLYGGSEERVAEIVTGLTARQGDGRASAWGRVLASLSKRPPATPREMIGVYTRSLSESSEHPYFLYFLGDAYAATGEPDLALRAWSQAAQAAPSWGMPLTRSAETLLSMGQAELAHSTAMSAVERSPNNPRTCVTFVQALYANWNGESSASARKLMTLVESARTMGPEGRQLSGIWIRLVEKLDGKDRAKEALRGLLGDPVAPAETSLLQLAAVSRELDLGLENACYDRLKSAYGDTPSLAYARAIELGDSKGEDGLRLIEQGSAAGNNTLQWRIVRARYMDRMNLPGAEKAWRELADGHSDRSDVLQMALTSRAVWNDLAFVDQLINHVRELSGDNGISWRVARAKWLMKAEGGERAMTEAAGLLTTVVKTAPHDLVARMLLAHCLERIGNTTAAEEQLAAASDIRPSTRIDLKRAQLLQDRGEYEQAEQLLRRMIEEQGFDPKGVRGIAALLARGGENREAVSLIERFQDDKQPPADLQLAGLYQRLNEPEKARAVYERIAQEATGASEVVAAASYFASTGDMDKAREVLAQLDRIDAPAETRAMVRAAFYADHVGEKEAMQAYKKATELAPQSRAAWLALCAYAVRIGALEEAQSAVDRAIKAEAVHPTFTLLQQRSDVWDVVRREPMIRPLVAEMIGDTSQKEMVLAAVEVFRRAIAGEAGLSAELRRVADRYTSSLPLQSLMVRVYLAQRRPADAIQVAMRAEREFPQHSEPSQLNVEALVAAGRWQEVPAAADEWRRRSGGRNFGADLLAAEAMLQNNAPQEASTLLQPYTAAAEANPLQLAPVRWLSARSYLAAGNLAEARAQVAPLLDAGPEWRLRAIRLVQSPSFNAQSAAQWLELVTPSIPDTDAAAIELASAWYRLGRTGGNDAWSGTARDMLSRIVLRTDAPADAFLWLGIIHEEDGRIADARQAYLNALKINAKQPVVLNNLASILLKQESETSAALDYARRAADLAPNDPRILDTLAQGQARAGDLTAAVTTRRRTIELDRFEPRWHVALMSLLIEADDTRGARQIYSQFRSMFDPSELKGDVLDQYTRIQQRLESQASAQ